MVDIQSAAAEIRRGIKKEDRKKPQGKNIMSASATQGGHNEKVSPRPRFELVRAVTRWTSVDTAAGPGARSENDWTSTIGGCNEDDADTGDQ